MGPVMSSLVTPIRMLELFSGTGSIGKVARQYGIEVTSVDINCTSNPTIITDILNFKYKKFPKRYFDIIWASPPCDTFSHLQFSNIGKKSSYWGVPLTRELIVRKQNEVGLPILNKTKEIINYLKPRFFYIENPKTGRMKDYMTEYNHTDVCYCMYGFNYKKPTRIWHNNSNFIGMGLMCNHNKHSVQIGGGSNQVKTLNERYSIPPGLVDEIIELTLDAM